MRPSFSCALWRPLLPSQRAHKRPPLPLTDNVAHLSAPRAPFANHRQRALQAPFACCRPWAWVSSHACDACVRSRSRALARVRALTRAHALSRAHSRLSALRSRGHSCALLRALARVPALTRAHARSSALALSRSLVRSLARPRSRARAHARSRALARALARFSALALSRSLVRSLARPRSRARAHARSRALARAHALCAPGDTVCPAFPFAETPPAPPRSRRLCRSLPHCRSQRALRAPFAHPRSRFARQGTLSAPLRVRLRSLA